MPHLSLWAWLLLTCGAIYLFIVVAALASLLIDVDPFWPAILAGRRQPSPDRTRKS